MTDKELIDALYRILEYQQGQESDYPSGRDELLEWIQRIRIVKHASLREWFRQESIRRSQLEQREKEIQQLIELIKKYPQEAVDSLVLKGHL